MIFTCLNCTKEFTAKDRRRKFCSHSCSATFSNIGRLRIPPVNQCLVCDQPSTYKCCSQKCARINQFETSVKPRVEDGSVAKSTTLKRYLSFVRGYQCELCENKGTHNGHPLVLQLDHVDGNSDNNFPPNLRLLCPNCHSQTPTFSTRQKKDTKRNRYLRKFKL